MDGIQVWEGDGDDTRAVPMDLRDRLVAFVEWFELLNVQVQGNGLRAFCNTMERLAGIEFVRNLRKREIRSIMDSARTLMLGVEQIGSDTRLYSEGMSVLAEFERLAP